MVAVALTRPKVDAVLGCFFFVVQVEVLTKTQHDHFPHFEFQRFSRKKNFVSWNVRTCVRA